MYSQTYDNLTTLTYDGAKIMSSFADSNINISSNKNILKLNSKIAVVPETSLG